MLIVHRTVSTPTPADRALTYLADFENATEWDSGTVSCTRTSGTGGPGTTYRNVSTFAGRKVELDYTVESLTDERMVIVGRNDTTTSRDTITVTPAAGGGSTVDYLAEFTFSGPARWIQPLLKPFFARLGNETAETLRRALDRL